MTWKWNQFRKRSISGFMVGLIFGLIFVSIAWLFALSYERLTIGQWLFGLIGAMLIFGLFFGLIFGLITGVFGKFTDRVKVGKASPNQGIKLSRKNALAAFLVTWLTGVLASKARDALPSGLIAGLIVGLFFALVVGLNRGGSAVIKHYVLRLILWPKGYTPFRFIKFLDHCARLILLKKVGGGYIFIHRMLLDYFADMAAQSTTNQVGTMNAWFQG